MTSDSKMAFPMRVFRLLGPPMLLVVFLVSIGAGVRLGLSLGRPFPGFAMMWRKEFKMYTVSYATPPHWSGLAAGVEIGDRILCIDGYQPNPEAVIYGVDPRYADLECPNGVKKYATVFQEQFSGSDPTVDLLVDRDGSIFTIENVPLIPFSFIRLLDVFLPSFLLSIALLAVGTIAYFANSSREINLVFAYLTALVAELVAVQTFPVIFSERMETMWLPTLFLIVPWVPFLGVVFFHLMGLLTDQEPLLRFYRRLRPFYYLFSFLLVLLGIYTYTADASETTVTIPFDWLFLGLFAGSCAFAGVWGIVSLSWTYFRTTSRRVKHQTRLILGGVLVVALAVMPYLAFFFIDVKGFYYLNNMPYMGLVFVAVTAYAILRYQLFTSRTAILKGLLIVNFCVVTANLVYLLVGQKTPFLPTLASAILVGLGLEARHGPTSFFNSMLRREVADYRAILQFSQSVVRPQKEEVLLNLAGRSFREDLDAAHVTIWLLDQKQQTAQHFREGEFVATHPVSKALTEHFGSQTGAVRATSSRAGDYRSLLEDGEPDRIVIWTPLVERGQAVGILGLGPRWTGEVYDERDLELIEILAHQLALSILNIRQMEHLRTVSERVRQAAESERRKIARELHDTILQFLLVLTYKLDDLREQHREIADEIEYWQERISIEAQRLRDLMSHLRAPELLVQQGLVHSLEDWIDGVEHDTEITLDMGLERTVEQVLSVEKQVALYRIFRETINNAMRHAQAEHFNLRLWQENDHVYFSVEDDGQGFDVSQALQVGGKGYCSLVDAHAYMESIGGELEISSTLGEGTVIRGRVTIETR